MLIPCKISLENVFDLHHGLRKALVAGFNSDGYTYPQAENIRIHGVFTEDPDFEVLMKLCEHAAQEGDTEYDGSWSASELFTFLKGEIKIISSNKQYYCSTAFGGLPPILALLPFLAVYSDIQILNVEFARNKWEARGDYRSEKRIGIQLHKGNFFIGKFGDDGVPRKENLTALSGLNIGDVHIGDTYAFGAYAQDSIDPEGKEPIEWLVLEKKKNAVLLISKQAIVFQPYNLSNEEATWESCSLRQWLNDTFLHQAFSTEEQSGIQSAKLRPSTNPKYKTSSGAPTTDRIFLLSIAEARKYFASNRERECTPTEYVIAQIAETLNRQHTSGNTCRWLLRTPGLTQKDAADVFPDGSISTIGSRKPSCVRPVVWVKLDG